VSPVVAIDLNTANLTVNDSGTPFPWLSMGVNCNAGATIVAFVNSGPDAATLNWIYSTTNPGGTVYASGTSLDTNVPTNEYDFGFDENRIEGQFVFANSAGVTTVNLHAFDGNGGGCEVRGTAEFSAQ
jgi:hypothetical protein